VVIIATVIAAGVPAYLIIRSELEQQARARLVDGVQITQTLLGNEQDRLLDLGNLSTYGSINRASILIFSLHTMRIVPRLPQMPSRTFARIFC